jgi:hypothetical protein
MSLDALHDAETGVDSLDEMGTMAGMSVIAPWVPQGLPQGNIWTGILNTAEEASSDAETPARASRGVTPAGE